MKVCYCDETGTGEEPVAIMVGVVVDCTRMHLSKDHWWGLLDTLSKIAGKRVDEIHTKDFYPGNGIWRGVDGPTRSRIVDAVCAWLQERKHDVVYASVDKKLYARAKVEGKIPKELNTVWRYLGFHLLLSLQKTLQKEKKNKGNFFLVLDNECKEELRFVDLIQNPPDWSDEYYSKDRKQARLDQVIDVPFFADSRDVALIQVADLVAFFLRRFVEIQEELVAPKYEGEERKISVWTSAFLGRSIGSAHIYPRRGRCELAEMYYQLAPRSLREA